MAGACPLHLHPDAAGELSLPCRAFIPLFRAAVQVFIQAFCGSHRTDAPFSVLQTSQRRRACLLQMHTTHARCRTVLYKEAISGLFSVWNAAAGMCSCCSWSVLRWQWAFLLTLLPTVMYGSGAVQILCAPSDTSDSTSPSDLSGKLQA